ncbi:3494_t:CDS:2 [Funneliformis geosporum]|uniref:3494_t:CDS:1 n=1 Tax=Funneliformis geosporum TaxID=1117311 RepID=A0A9W4SB81_9GLOM|nr:3494_t:CDS:2 [Funneliformis geosporum]
MINNKDSSMNDNDEQNIDKEIPKSLIINIDERNSIDSIKITAELTKVNEEKEVNENSKDNPFNWSKRKKWFTLVVLSCGATISPISCIMFYPAVLEVRNQLHTTSMLTNASISIYLIFQGIGPLGWAAYSDSRQTRKNVYIFSLILFIVASVICAIINNIWWLIIIRIIQACGSSALHAIGPTTIKLGNAFGFFYLFPIIGPLMGPVIGGYVTEYFGWRWIFWLMAIMGIIVLILIFFFVPETYPKRKPNTTITTTSVSSSSPNSSNRKFINPFAPLSLFRYPNLSIIILYLSILLSFIYLQGALIPIEFSKGYNLTAAKLGLMFLSPALGYMFGSVIGGRYADYFLKNAKRTALIAQRKEIEKIIEKDENNMIILESIQVEPEIRIHGTWLGSIIVSISFLAFSWLLEYRVSIIFPIIFMFLGGFGQLLAFTTVFTYLVESFPTQSASINSDLTFSRQLVAGLLSLFSVPIDEALGVGWTFSLVVFLNIIGTLSVIVVLFKGKQWRLKFKQDFNLK